MVAFIDARDAKVYQEHRSYRHFVQHIIGPVLADVEIGTLNALYFLEHTLTRPRFSGDQQRRSGVGADAVVQRHLFQQNPLHSHQRRGVGAGFAV